MRKVALNQQNGQHPPTSLKHQRAHDYERMRLALVQALDQNDTLRNRLCLLQALLIQSNQQNQVKIKRIKQLEECLQTKGSQRNMAEHQRRNKGKRSFSQ